MNLRLVAAASLGLLFTVSSALAEEETWIALGQREPAAAIISRTGEGTENAVVEGRVTPEEAKQHCENFSFDTSDEAIKECAEGILQEYDKTYRVTANCVAGKLTTVFGDEVTYAGEQKRLRDGQSPHVSLWKTADGTVLPAGPGDSGLLAAQNWSAVCGPNFKPGQTAQSRPAEVAVEKASTSTALWTMGPRNEGFDGISYNHNGSSMLVDERLGEIRYDIPKKAIAGTVKKGTVLFRGTFRDIESDPAKGYVRGVVEGTAYVFKKGCEPAPYAVSGTYDSTTITMSGRAPKRDPRSCAILALSHDSPHAVLTFEFEGDE